jgi:hypothetical protein
MGTGKLWGWMEETDPVRTRLPALSWGTEGGARAAMNLLRTGTAIGLRV